MYERKTATTLAGRLRESRRFIQIVTGPRQTGKTTAVQQALQAVNLPARIASGDAAQTPGADWIRGEWLQARRLASPETPAILVLDEIQKVGQWSEVVKALWDEDTWNGTNLLVVLSGSSSLLIQKGLSESLAGRFELIRSTHWSFAEMREAFGYSLEDYLVFGGYPGCAPLHGDENRWRTYMRDSIIEATISRDVLQMEDVRKPALMRALFELVAQYSAQELSYRKILGQLDDKGNTDVIRHYLDLLSGAGMMSGLQKYENKQLKSRASSPRLMVHDSSLMTATWRGPGSLLDDAPLRGHLVETAVGAYLIARCHTDGFNLYWWREGNAEVDFVIQQGRRVTAIEVKSGRVGKSGMATFCRKYPEAQPLVVGDGNTPLERFLAGDVPLFA